MDSFDSENGNLRSHLYLYALKNIKYLFHLHNMIFCAKELLFQRKQKNIRMAMRSVKCVVVGDGAVGESYKVQILTFY